MFKKNVFNPADHTTRPALSTLPYKPAQGSTARPLFLCHALPEARHRHQVLRSLLAEDHPDLARVALALLLLMHC